MKTLTASLLFSAISLSCFAIDAKVIKIRGEATSNGNTLKLGDTLSEGDEIVVTGKESFLQVKLDDGSMILQKEGKMRLKVLKKGQSLIRFLKGKIFIFKNPAEKSKLNIRTDRVAMAVRGTKFYVEETDQTYLCVCEGTVAARNKKGTVNVSAGEDLFSSSKSTLEKKKAKEMMIDMASEGFKIMGIPVKN